MQLLKLYVVIRLYALKQYTLHQILLGCWNQRASRCGMGKVRNACKMLKRLEVNILKWVLKKYRLRVGQGSTGPVESSCEHSDKLSGSIDIQIIS